ncbi:MAG: peptidylprolyl isomerase [Opitutaceae bacterium]|nr:peptidylprolyl isomerase [Opitutaceae bacterium]
MPPIRILVTAIVLGSSVCMLQAQTLPYVVQRMPDRTVGANSPAFTINLKEHFGLPSVTNQVVRFSTSSGIINVEMLPQYAPNHVTNFLNYVNAGAYTNTIIHRSAVFQGVSSTPAIIQGGGYLATGYPPPAIAKNAPVALEVNAANSRGTLAAARTSSPNSATSEWYFNVIDNTTTLGPSNGGGYTVFGRALGGSLPVIDAIAAIPRYSGGSFTEIPLRNYTGGNPNANTYVLVNSITPVSIYPGDSALSVLTFTTSSNNEAVATSALNGSTLTVTPKSQSGTASISVQATDSNGAFALSAFKLTVEASSSPPTIVQSPTSQTIATGSTVAFTGSASGNAVTYQWRRNGQPISGATLPTLLLKDVTAAQAGNYSLVATNSVGSVESGIAVLTVVPASQSSRLTNLSIRSIAGLGEQTLIAGFTIAGAASSNLVIRGIGPTLANFQVPNVLANPRLDLYLGQTVLASNDNWTGSDGSTVGGFPLATGSLDSVLTTSLSPGGYTAQVKGPGTTTGAAMAEVYEAGAVAGSEITNLSARTQLGAGEVLIGGFTLTGSASRTVLIRAIGPGLAPYGVTGVLADPKIEIFSGSNRIDGNDNWGGSSVLVDAGDSVGAFRITENASKDAMSVVTLPPGGYTVHVSSGNGAAGVVLLEVYSLR